MHCADTQEEKTMNELIQMVQGIQLCLNPPEWMKQYIQIQSGEKTWDDFSFEERTCKGWLWPLLLQIDNLPRLVESSKGMIFEDIHPAYLRGGSGRWRWWMDTYFQEKLPDSEIPQINFLGLPDHETMRMLEKCLDTNWNYRLPDFLDWILWGFGEGKERPRIDEKTNEKWYRTFNLGLMIVNPTDYWGALYSETKGRGSWNRSGFYPTPQHVCNLMAQISYFDAKNEEGKKIDPRLLAMTEPCCGTGRMLMEASNYTVNISGCDIDYVCVTATKVNAYLYMPWVARPASWVSKLRAEQEVTGNKSHEEIIADIIKEVDPEYRVVFEGQSKTGIHKFKIKSGPAKKSIFKVDKMSLEEFRKKYEEAVRKRVNRNINHKKAA